MWSNLLEAGPWISMVGLDDMMSLFALHSLMIKIRCGASMGGLMNLQSLD